MATFAPKLGRFLSTLQGNNHTIGGRDGECWKRLEAARTTLSGNGSRNSSMGVQRPRKGRSVGIFKLTSKKNMGGG